MSAPQYSVPEADSPLAASPAISLLRSSIGYEVLALPKMRVEKRADFVLNALAQH